jgi:hypothetical protein
MMTTTTAVQTGVQLLLALVRDTLLDVTQLATDDAVVIATTIQTAPALALHLAVPAVPAAIARNVASLASRTFLVALV